ncbi:MAG: UbiX family flavin prenyltransferase [Acidobacteria bacterium]|nr:UbiX family flavin prenyltransferase [Acidobacteriota bacterium]
MAGKTIVVGISGASGAVYAQRLLQLLAVEERVARVHVVVSSGGQRVLREELGISCREAEQIPAVLVGRAADKFEYLHNANIGASIASGSYATDAMVVIPCSMGTLGAIAGGISDNLMRRAADVHLKEGRPLLLCWRDTPLNQIHLENMLRLARAGATIYPINPGYYHGAETLAELVNQFCLRLLEKLGLPQAKQYQWKGTKG